MSHSENVTAAADDRSLEYNVEFRSFDDDAWYSVRVVLDRGGEALRVKFLSFGDDHDRVFEANCFKNFQELEDLKERFRPVSLQLQDDQCRSVVPSVTVCACYHYCDEDIRFYDATLFEVQEKEHSFHDGEEECLCAFYLLWLHGPFAGTYSCATVADICKIQPISGLDPVVASFLKMAREKIEATSNSVSYSMGVSGLDLVPSCDGSQITKQKRSFFELLQKETRCARRSVSGKPSKCKNRIAELPGRGLEDRDLGGMKKLCMILIGNLDKTLSPPTIEEFLHRHTAVSPRVCIFPSLSSELFTRGAFLFDCERDFQKVRNFLNDPNQIIISSGRPWVVIEEAVGLKNIKASIRTLMPSSKRKTIPQECDGKANNLRIIRHGTQEFKMVSDLRDLFMEFSAHQEQLHKRLAFEEGMVFFGYT